jgi:hypothetical protein
MKISPSQISPIISLLRRSLGLKQQWNHARNGIIASTRILEKGQIVYRGKYKLPSAIAKFINILHYYVSALCSGYAKQICL